MCGEFHSGSLTRIDIERRLAKRVRAARVLSGLTLQKTAAILGISTQQMHKYETGTNRIHARMLWEIASLLEIPIDEFFTDKFLLIDDSEIDLIDRAATLLQSTSLISDNNLISILLHLSFALSSEG